VKNLFQVYEESRNVMAIKRSYPGQAAAIWSSNAQVRVMFHESIKPVDTCQSLYPNLRVFKLIFTASS
jgi:hypothetical protein